VRKGPWIILFDSDIAGGSLTDLVANCGLSAFADIQPVPH